MLRVTSSLLELRRWAESRGARPCRDADTGEPRLLFAGEACGSTREVGWDEFEPTFRARGGVFVYDDAPGGTRCFVGDVAAARRVVEEAELAHGGLALP